jgi:hypothetical protein
MIKLQDVTLLGVDGGGNRPLITKAMQISKKNIKFSECILLSPHNNYDFFDDIKHIKIPKLNYAEWNRFMIKELHNYVSTNHYIFVDTDGFIINSNLWDNEYLNYDYVGASWLHGEFEGLSVGPHQNYANIENIICKNDVGNGGFTLRSKKLLNIIKYLPYDELPPKILNEDAYICIKNYDILSYLGIKFAPTDLAKKFSIEKLGLPDPEKSFGFHGNKNFINLFN